MKIGYGYDSANYSLSRNQNLGWPRGKEMKMNYQVDYGNGYENVYPDGYGMHEPHVAKFDNVIEGEAHIASPDSNHVTRVQDNTFSNDPNVTGFDVVGYPEAGMPDNYHVDSFETEAELREWLATNYKQEDCRFDDDYECSGCWSPETGDSEVWFKAVEETGAIAARAGNELRVFDADKYYRLGDGE